VRGNRLGLYRAIFGDLLFFPVGYALSALPVSALLTNRRSA
jgi:hypothetical protein